jgi:hypothetical protein
MSVSKMILGGAAVAAVRAANETSAAARSKAFIDEILPSVSAEFTPVDVVGIVLRRGRSVKAAGDGARNEVLRL